ncbi:MAG: 50S ribosomal protein L11 methyltransferase [Gemmatimonadetes bacterium]|nr:50S ribosomal protein L11 methyltransferase [Gemmatimonadota bacterium]
MRARPWLYIEIESPSAEHHSLLAEGLVTFGASAVQEHGDRVSTWLPLSGVDRGTGQDSRAAAEHVADTVAAEAAVALLRAALDAVAGVALRLRWELRADEDWEARWREGLSARRVGKHIIVTPSWIQPETRAGDIVIVIDPEMAFGTGEHASTRGALRLVEKAVRPGCRVLDVGTGSGILAAVAARLGAVHVEAVDSDPVALGYAADNLVRNACADCVALSAFTVDLDYLFGTAVAAGRYDVIVANVLSGVLVSLLPGFHAAARAGGALILAGILEPEADSVIEAAAHHAFTLVDEDRDEGWWAGWFQRSVDSGSE